jgi:hypothetical protein
MTCLRVHSFKSVLFKKNQPGATGSKYLVAILAEGVKLRTLIKVSEYAFTKHIANFQKPFFGVGAT